MMNWTFMTENASSKNGKFTTTGQNKVKRAEQIEHHLDDVNIESWDEQVKGKKAKKGMNSILIPRGQNH